MIIRLFHAKVRPGKQAEFKKVLELLSIPHIQSRNGMVAFYPGQVSGAASDEFVLVTIWKDEASLRRMSEEEWARAIIPVEARPLLEAVRVHRYEAFGIPEMELRPLYQNI